MEIIDGRKLRDEILIKVKEGISALNFQPVFCDILVGDNPVSAQYVRMKANKAEEVGIKFHHANFPADITTENLVEKIKDLNKYPDMCGIIIQLPLPASIDRRQVLDAIDPRLDVDCLGQICSEEFYKGNSRFGPPTAVSCMALLDSTGLDLKDKNILILGQGELVGRPTTALCKFRNLIPNILVKDTPNQAEFFKNADVIISGTGAGHLIKGDMIKRGVAIIDAGTSTTPNGIIGDVDMESVKDIAGFVSPVPGGVGPVTVAILLQNVLTVAKGFNEERQNPHPQPLSRVLERGE